MNAHEQDMEIELLIRARYPIIYITSWEETRIVELIKQISQKTSKKAYEWSCSSGLTPAGVTLQSLKLRNTGTRDPIAALDSVLEQAESAIYIFKDFHPFLAKTNHTVIRKLRDIALMLKSSYKTLILLSPFLQLPPDLEKDITVVDYQLPGMDDLGVLLDQVIADVKDNPNITVDLHGTDREDVLKAAMGLTLAEAENVFAKALVSEGRLDRNDVKAIFAEKRQIIRKSGLLDYLDVSGGFDQLGGMENIKDWLIKRRQAFSDRAREFGLPTPSGALLLGIQGCGKSLCAKAVSAAWELPLLRFDIGRIFSSYVGSSEENMRQAIRTAEGIAPCVLWVDEIDKAFGGLGGNSTDGGTSQRVLANFLTWMAEKTSPVFVIATANNIRVLPPELLRKGRFDEIFFVDLPNRSERQNIFDIHLRRRSRPCPDEVLLGLADATAGFSGAEIEQVVVSALHEAYFDSRDLTTEDLSHAIHSSVPLSRTMAEEIDALREWCTTRARPASVPDVVTEQPVARRLEFANL